MRVNVLCMSLLLLLAIHAYSSECDIKTLTLSKLEIELTDKNYLEMIMGFSYGPEVKKFIPDLLSIESRIYSKDPNGAPVMTFLITKYKSDNIAKEALAHLKSKWAGNTKNQYDFLQVGKEVTWFGNNELDKDCFFKISKIEKERLIKK